MLLHHKNHWKYTCGLQITIMGGSRSEGHDSLAFTHAAEHLMFSGTEKYTKAELHTFYNRYFAGIEARTSFDCVELFCYFDISDFAVVSDVLEQMLFHWKCDKKTFQHELRGIREEMKEYHGSERQKCFSALFALAGIQGPSALGYPEHIRNLSFNDSRRIRAHWDRLLEASQRHVTIISGGLSQKAVNSCRRLFSKNGVTPEIAEFAPRSSVYKHAKQVAGLIIEASYPHPYFILLHKLFERRAYALAPSYDAQFIAIGDQYIFGVFNENGVEPKTAKRIFTTPPERSEFEILMHGHVQYLHEISDTVDIFDALHWLSGFFAKQYAGLPYPSKEQIETYFSRVTFRDFTEFCRFAIHCQHRKIFLDH